MYIVNCRFEFDEIVSITEFVLAKTWFEFSCSFVAGPVSRAVQQLSRLKQRHGFRCFV
jgi:hypothetical protein